MRLVWENDRAAAPDGTVYMLDVERVRGEPAAWSVLARRPGRAGEPAERLRPAEPPWPTKARARRVAEEDAGR